MVASPALLQLDEIAQNLFQVLARFGLSLPRARRRGGDLKEIEFLTLSLLQQHDTMIVGEIQRQLGVLPAQMSRILRSLEMRERPLVACRINPHDKRKVDVTMTTAGLRAVREYQSGRVQQLSALLGRLPEGDLDCLQRLLDRFQELLAEKTNGTHH